MFKTFVAGLTALSLTFATPAPASAGSLSEDDLGKIILGLITLGVVGAAIDNNRDERHDDDDDDDRRYFGQQPRGNAFGHQPHQNLPRGNAYGHDRGGFVRPDVPQHTQRGQFGTHNLRALPLRCLEAHQTRFGPHRMFTRSCLERAGVNLRQLPDRCKVRIVSYSGPRAGFDPACLRREGFRGQH